MKFITGYRDKFGDSIEIHFIPGPDGDGPNEHGRYLDSWAVVDVQNDSEEVFGSRNAAFKSAVDLVNFYNSL